MALSNSEQLGLILGGSIGLAVLAAIGAFVYEDRKAKKKAEKKRKIPLSARSLGAWSRELGIEFDPNDPNDPLAALIAAGEYFRMPGCEPGGPHYEETFNRILHMIEDMVPDDRVDFWRDQVYRLYGTAFLLNKKKKED